MKHEGLDELLITGRLITAPIESLGDSAGMSPSGMPGGHMGAMPSGQIGERPGGGQSATDRGSGGERAGTTSEGRTPAQLLQQNTKLSENLSKLLPAGTNLQTAAAGFKNLGEFVAAVHVSHNLGIPFADLKAKMLGGDSLGQAIRTLRPLARLKKSLRVHTTILP